MNKPTAAQKAALIDALLSSEDVCPTCGHVEKKTPLITPDEQLLY